MKTTKRILSMLLALTVVLSVCAVPAFADDTASNKITFTEFVANVIAGGGKYDGQGVTVEWSPVSGCFDTRDGHTCTVNNTAAVAETPNRVNSGLAQYQIFDGLDKDLVISNVKFKYVPKDFVICANSDWKGSFTAEKVKSAELHLYNTRSVTFTGCTFDQVVLTPWKKADNTNTVARTATITGCTFQNIYDSYAIKDVHKENIVISNNTFENCGGGIMISNTSGSAKNVKSVVISGNTFTNVDTTTSAAQGKAGTRGLIQVQEKSAFADGAVFNVVGNKSDSSAPVFRYRSASQPTIVFKDNTLPENTPMQTEAGSKNEEGKLSVETQIVTEPEAKIGDIYYATLQAAVNSGNTKSANPAVLQKDIDLKDEPLVISATAAIDLNGKKLTRSVKNTDGSKNTGVIEIASNKYFTVKDSIGGGAVEANSDLSLPAVYINSKGNITLMNGGALNGGDNEYAVVNNDGGVVVKAGGKITGTSTTKALIQNNGASSKVSIGNGKSDTGENIVTAGAAIVENNDGAVTITDGTITSNTEIVSGSGKVTVTGGTFNNDPSKYVSSDSSIVKNADGTFTVALIPIAEVNGVKYTDLTAARKAAQNGVLKLLVDFDEPNKTVSLLEVGNYSLTLDLNGHTMRAAGGEGVLAVNEGILTINEPGKVIAVESAHGDKTAAVAAFAYNGGKIIINGGEFIQEITGTDTQYDMIYSAQGFNGAKSASIEINGGTFKCETPKWTLNVQDNSGSTISVKGGTFIGYNPAYAESESPVANFVAEGYESVSDGSGNYTVQKKSEQVKLFDQIVVLRGKTPWLFAAVDSLDYDKAGFKLTVDGKTETVEASIVCDSVKSGEKEVKASELSGGKYLFGIQLNNTYRAAFNAVPYVDNYKGEATYFDAATSGETSAE